MTSWGPDSTFALTSVKTYNNLSNNSTWVGTDVQRNRAQTANQFVNSTAGDYTLTANNILAGKKSNRLWDDRLDPTPPIPTRAAHPTPGPSNSAPRPWTAGANWRTWLFENQTAAPLVSALHVTSGNVRTSSGSLVVGNAGGVDTRAFLKFDLSNVDDAPMVQAILRIYENAVPDSASGNVLAVSHHLLLDRRRMWAYNQSVDAGSPLLGFYDPANLDFYTDINVTSTVLGWLSDPATNFGFSLRGTEGIAGTAKYFEGLYGTTVPQLVITYAVSRTRLTRPHRLGRIMQPGYPDMAQKPSGFGRCWGLGSLGDIQFT